MPPTARRKAAGGGRRGNRPKRGVAPAPTGNAGRAGRRPGTTLLETKPELYAMLVDRVRATDSVPTAAESAGLDPDTVYNWMKRGGQPDEPRIFADFSVAIKEARALYVIDKMLIIRKAAAGTPDTPPVPGRRGRPGTPGRAGRTGAWQAAAWLLERRRDEFKLKPPDAAPPEQGASVEVRFIDARDERHRGPRGGGDEKGH